MVGEDRVSELLEYLKKAGPINTFRLASVMNLERSKLLQIIGRLEEKEAVKFERGNVIFLKFPSEEKPVKTILPKLEKKKTEKAAVKRPVEQKLLQIIQTENAQLQGKVSELKETVKELEKKASVRPKTITRTVTKTIIKKVPVTKTIIKKILVPHRPLKKKGREKPKAKPMKFRLPRFKLLGNITRLRKPEFIK